jgi:hypothetical protein
MQISRALTTVRNIFAKQSVKNVQETAGDTVGFKCCPRLLVTVLNTLELIQLYVNKNDENEILHHTKLEIKGRNDYIS